MHILLQQLKDMPAFKTVREELLKGHKTAVTGVGQICRSHFIAGLYTHTHKPITVICQDDMAAKKIQSELSSFLSMDVPSLCSRELTLYDSAVVSRAWEQKRLRQLYDYLQGHTRLQIMAWDALSQRTIPPEILQNAVFEIHAGSEYSLDAIQEKLVGAGYAHCAMVEGPGQFAVRGGILDIYSPAADHPVRIEFFGDEVDTMGYFDPATQRRVENADSITVLPVGETQPRLHREGLAGLCQDISKLIATQKRRKNIHEELIKTLERDLEKYENNLSNPASDRYMGFIYRDFATAADYIPDDSIIVMCDQANIHRSARSRTEELGMQLDSMLQAGLLAGELCDFACQWDDFCFSIQNKTILYMDTFAGSAYPEGCGPKTLLPVSAKQLPGYGGSLDTACADLSHYQNINFYQTNDMHHL